MRSEEREREKSSLQRKERAATHFLGSVLCTKEGRESAFQSRDIKKLWFIYTVSCSATRLRLRKNVLTYGNSIAGVRPLESEGDATHCDLVIRKRGRAGIKLGSEMSLPAQCPSAGKKSYTATPRHFKFCDEKHSSARSYKLRKRILRTRDDDRSAWKITHTFCQLLRTVFSSHLSLSDSLLEDFVVLHRRCLFETTLWQ